MKKLVFLSFIFASAQLYAQKGSPAADQIITTPEIEAHLSFLAADEMRGRNAGSPELDIAANYLRAMFRINGVKPVAGTDNFFQPVQLVKNLPATHAQASVNGVPFTLKESLLIIDGDSMTWNGEMIYVGYGSDADLEKYNVKGKMVLALAGAEDADNLNKVFSTSMQKIKSARDAGALGLVELLALPQAPWPALVNYLSQTQWSIRYEGKTIPHIWLKPSDIKALSLAQGNNVKGSINMSGKKKVDVPGKNVAGIIEGTDAKLKDEYIVVTAHYDHIGVQNARDGQDSIFNGARDNAIGTVALLQTAKYLRQNPPKRSVILLALTSEEKGLLGSSWYAEHPLVPLKNTVLNINCDGVGYNDKSIVTSISFGRTSTDDVVKKAAGAYGLGVGGDPDPRENFFERSDQVSFARKGVVAIKLQPGLAQMDDEIRKYYHRQADEVSSLDMDYLTKFYRTFVTAVHLLANDAKRPSWKKGDKFEEVSKELYGGR